MELSVCKVFEFEYAHFLPQHEGKCKNVHGHSGKLEIEIFGPVGANGMVMDFGNLKKIVTENITSKLDHIFLNNHPTEFTENPTAENIVLWVRMELQKYLPISKLIRRVRVWETSSSYAEWRNE